MMTAATGEEKVGIAAFYAVSALAFLSIAVSERTRLWFADLSRPLVSEELRDVLSQWRTEPANPHLCARLAVLYERAGLRRKANRILQQLRTTHPRTIYLSFVEAVLSYRQRKYKFARTQFLQAADLSGTDPQLRGSLLAAAGCAAFAQGDMEGALNLSERALEFDDASLVARMVKVDVFLRTGKKEQAGEEIIAAIRRGLDLDLESKVPLDTDRALQRMGRIHAAEKRAMSKVQ
jgi:tetratricopeptide (TPR) repeat protein